MSDSGEHIPPRAWLALPLLAERTGPGEPEKGKEGSGMSWLPSHSHSGGAEGEWTAWSLLSAW